MMNFKNTVFVIILFNSFLAYGASKQPSIQINVKTNPLQAASKSDKDSADAKAQQAQCKTQQVAVNYVATTTSSPETETYSQEEWNTLASQPLRTRGTVVDQKGELDLANRKAIINTIFDSVKKGNLKAVQVFVETYKQNVNTADKKGNTLLMLAVKHLETPVVDYLLTHKDINTFETDLKGNTALQTAVNTAKPIFVQKIFRKQREQDPKKALDTADKALKQAQALAKIKDYGFHGEDAFDLSDGYKAIVKYLQAKQAELI